jgi:hypothetical protein
VPAQTWERGAAYDLRPYRDLILPIIYLPPKSMLHRKNVPKRQQDIITNIVPPSVIGLSTSESPILNAVKKLTQLASSHDGQISSKARFFDVMATPVLLPDTRSQRSVSRIFPDKNDISRVSDLRHYSGPMSGSLA